MGCSPSNSSSSSKGDKDSSNCLIVQIVDPQNQHVVELKYHGVNNKKEDYLMNIMNTIFFADEKNSKIDICFNSLYCKKDDRYHYYLYRLLNVEIENVKQPYSGKLWVLYIQNKPMDWDQIVNTNQKFDFSKGGKIVWKFEKYTQATAEHLSVTHEISQQNNLDYLKNVGQYETKMLNDQSRQQTGGVTNQQNLYTGQDKSTTDNTQISLQKRTSQEQEDVQKKKYANVGYGLDAPSSIFNPELQGHPNTRKLLVTESSNIYQNNINYLNTEDDVRQIQPPLQTEVGPIENSDYRNVFDTQNNEDSAINEKNQIWSFNGTKKSSKATNGFQNQRNSSGNKEQLYRITSDKKIEQTVKYLEGDENIISEKESARDHSTNANEQKNLHCANTHSYKFQEHFENTQKVK
ncbi:hypothetical protein TTHERM_00047250 (macronuclear) [Tetrahymena thermophila SB210]|uniref:Uncharacterized protein n=1 Tax=Tetrahymena thermophila (strain SB210) TaxID=312017 RepID=Q23DG6_TETTS|nr:hypothetical protein TTHERM_00047250 [Tetrahymena thermophila SB210]EAR94370.1 hypothetical protein TTHERM_00047250 [Tetrahymena thermophila SB210]|eukprot:XP_001014720.1 hypothetical protein TTHERM_00047250 [Tetrahymena thermophila SB210]